MYRKNDNKIEKVASLIHWWNNRKRQIRRLIAIIVSPFGFLVLVSKSTDLLTMIMVSIVGLIFIMYNVIMLRKEKDTYIKANSIDEVAYYDIRD